MLCSELIGICVFRNSLGNDTRHASMQRVSELECVSCVFIPKRRTHISFSRSIELNTWKDSLSPEVDLTASSRPVALPHRMTLHLTYWWLLILLHRPFYRRHRGGAMDIDHVKVCFFAFLHVPLFCFLHMPPFPAYPPLYLYPFSCGSTFILSDFDRIILT